MDRLDMIFELVKSLDSKSDTQSESLTRVETDLKYHIKRTDLLENALDHRTEVVEAALQTKFTKPSLRKVGIVLGIIGSAVGIAVTLGWL